MASESTMKCMAQRCPVILMEQQGHGHTGDRPAKPMTIDQMVKDTAGDAGRRWRQRYVRIDHAASVARIIPKARLAVLPGTRHFGVVKSHAWLEPMIKSLVQSVVRRLVINDN